MQHIMNPQAYMARVEAANGYADKFPDHCFLATIDPNYAQAYVETRRKDALDVAQRLQVVRLPGNRRHHIDIFETKYRLVLDDCPVEQLGNDPTQRIFGELFQKEGDNPAESLERFTTIHQFYTWVLAKFY